ncbi:hypothetical protein ECDEC15A_2658 [Escherichia coli DEC15A]|nr:hypothetical protein ECDEC15A_2658 [Escherichia coli DEC15A]
MLKQGKALLMIVSFKFCFYQFGIKHGQTSLKIKNRIMKN